MKCNNCGSVKLENDSSRGTIYCTQCGTIQEENMMVASLNFTEENGASLLTGQIIKMTDTFNRVGTSFIASNNHAIQTTIRSICTSLGLGEEHAMTAYRWYKLSLQHNLTKGRSILYTLSACIYIVCRQEKTPHLLIDFSVSLRINVFKIGKIFLKLVKLLNIQVPLIDPSLFIHRFVNRLKFKNERVLMLAVRIVSRMKRDWIVVGRRPNNVCGAAIVVAGRMLGEERTVQEVAKAVHVSVNTICRRLKEMGETESANLSVGDFYNVWLEREAEPPSVQGAVECPEEESTATERMDENTENIYKTPSYTAEEVDEISEDSEEIDCLILSNDEYKLKEALWDEMYGEFLKEKENRVVVKKSSCRKKKKVDDVKTVKASSKINYAAISSLFD